MTTSKAFSQLVKNRELFLSLKNMSADNYRKIKQRHKEKTLTDQLKKKWLIKAGYIHTPEDWKAPKK